MACRPLASRTVLNGTNHMLSAAPWRKKSTTNSAYSALRTVLSTRSVLVLAQPLDISCRAVSEPAVELGLIFQLLAPQAGDDHKAGINLRQRRHVHPQLLELGNREDVFLAVAPALLHLLERDVRGHLRPEGANGGSDLFPVVEISAGQGEGSEQLIEINPAGVRVVVAQGELGFLARHGEALDQADPAIDACQAAATVFEAAGDDLEGEARAAPGVPAPQNGINIGPESINVVEQQILQLRTLRQQPCQDAISQEVGHFIPVADGVQALERQIVRVVAGFARAAGPVDQ